MLCFGERASQKGRSLDAVKDGGKQQVRRYLKGCRAE